MNQQANKKILELGGNGVTLKDKPPVETNSPDNFYWVLQASEVGFSIALPIVAGAFLGLWLDKKIGTQPIMTLIGIMLGVLLSAAKLMGLVREFSKKR
ncbi:MAG: AtpZ/AtpI family protein [Patescibacteria group bacterium]